MGSGCMYSHSALGCVDAGAPLRATYKNLYRWPESDAEFVKSVSSGEQRRRAQPRYQYRSQPQPLVVDSYSCRQMYLRSYTFSKKETVAERTRKCLGRVKEKVAAVAVKGKGVSRCLQWGPAGRAADDRSVRVASSGAGSVRSTKKVKQQQLKKKRCLVMRRLREVSAAALRSLFRSLLFCTAAVDVADRQPS